jgi:hypothetical protein
MELDEMDYEQVLSKLVEWIGQPVIVTYQTLDSVGMGVHVGTLSWAEDRQEDMRERTAGQANESAHDDETMVFHLTLERAVIGGHDVVDARVGTVMLHRSMFESAYYTEEHGLVIQLTEHFVSIDPAT